MKKSTKSNTIIKSICAILVVTILLFTFTACGDNKDKELVSTTEPTIKEIVSSTEKAVVKPIEDETHSESSTTKESETELTTKPAPVPETTKKQEDKPVTTTKKQEVNTTKPVTTTKKPVETQVIKETTTKAPETTKKPTTTKAEYYPALTQADIEEIKQYTINYIRSKGQIVEPYLNWNNAGYSTVNTVPTDLSIGGVKYKINGGVDPVEWVKGRMRDAVDVHIEDYERVNGEGSIAGLYPLVKLENGYWNFALGYC